MPRIELNESWDRRIRKGPADIKRANLAKIKNATALRTGRIKDLWVLPRKGEKGQSKSHRHCDHISRSHVVGGTVRQAAAAAAAG
jgi:hypothetical protein